MSAEARASVQTGLWAESQLSFLPGAGPGMEAPPRPAPGGGAQCNSFRAGAGPLLRGKDWYRSEGSG